MQRMTSEGLVVGLVLDEKPTTEQKTVTETKAKEETPKKVPSKAKSK